LRSSCLRCGACGAHHNLAAGVRLDGRLATRFAFPDPLFVGTALRSIMIDQRAKADHRPTQ
jgi:hypothetical protein